MSVDWKVKDDMEVLTEEFWYDLTDGGYIKPEEILEDAEQIKALQEAIALVKSFEDAVCEEY